LDPQRVEATATATTAARVTGRASARGTVQARARAKKGPATKEMAECSALMGNRC